MRLSGDGVMYIPSGQWPVCLREAYSRETAVRVRALLVDDSAFDVLLVESTRVFCLDGRLFVGVEKSSEGEGTRLLSIRPAIRAYERPS